MTNPFVGLRASVDAMMSEGVSIIVVLVSGSYRFELADRVDSPLSASLDLKFISELDREGSSRS